MFAERLRSVLACSERVDLVLQAILIHDITSGLYPRQELLEVRRKIDYFRPCYRGLHRCPTVS